MMSQEDFDDLYTTLPLNDNILHSVIATGWCKKTVRYRDEEKVVLHFDIVALDERPLKNALSWETRSSKVIGKLRGAILEAQQKNINGLYFKICRKPDNTYIVTDITPMNIRNVLHNTNYGGTD